MTHPQGKLGSFQPSRWQRSSLSFTTLYLHLVILHCTISIVEKILHSRFRSGNVDFSTFEVVYSRVLLQNEDTDQLIILQISNIPCIELRGILAASHIAIFRVAFANVASTTALNSHSQYIATQWVRVCYSLVLRFQRAWIVWERDQVMASVKVSMWMWFTTKPKCVVWARAVFVVSDPCLNCPEDKNYHLFKEVLTMSMLLKISPEVSGQWKYNELACQCRSFRPSLVYCRPVLIT